MKVLSCFGNSTLFNTQKIKLMRKTQTLPGKYSQKQGGHKKNFPMLFKNK